MTTWSNWSGTVRCTPREILRPASEDDLIRILGEASQRGESVRPVGTGHSHTPLAATDGVLLAFDAMTGIRDHDLAGNVRVGAGSVLSSLGAPLRDLGRAMENLGDVDVQTLAGALGTGTHGTGRRLGGLATQVEALRLVTPGGEMLACSPAQHPEIFDVARVSLGALGILTEVTLRTLPAYRLHERTLREEIETCLEAFEDRAERHRHCEFFWYPGKDTAEVKLIDATDAAPDPLPDRPYERIDHSDRVLPSARELRFVEMEYALPAENGLAAFRELREMVKRRRPQLLWPVELRTVAADDVPLSPAFGRDTVTLSVHQGNELPFEAFFADAESVMRNHAGRPHWGKCHGLEASVLRDLYPRWNDFVRIREQLDPDGLLTTPALRALLG